MPKKTPYIKTKELYELLSHNTGLSEVRIRSLFEYLVSIMVDELKYHGRVNIEGIGTFTAHDYGGKDKKMSTDGIDKKIYVEKRKRVYYRPSGLLEDLVNEKIPNTKAKKLNLDRKYEMQYEEEVKDDDDDIVVGDIFNIANNYFAKKNKEKKKGASNG